MQVKSRAVLGQISDMDIRLLRVFRAVVECGGMAAAELELNIATSTISRHIKDLETRLGLTLCRRGRGGFALTPEGERIHAETLRLLAATEAFRAGVDDIHQRMGGELHLAVFDKTASNPQARIAQAVARFQQVALLADPKVEGNRPWLEMAIVESAKAFAQLGNTAEREAMVALYRQHFPKGARAKELEALPAGGGRAPGAAPQAKP